MVYAIVRKHFHGDDKVIKKGLTLEEAQNHINDPETSSSTCEGKESMEYTKEYGEWFDIYYEEN